MFKYYMIGIQLCLFHVRYVLFSFHVNMLFMKPIYRYFYSRYMAKPLDYLKNLCWSCVLIVYLSSKTMDKLIQVFEPQDPFVVWLVGLSSRRYDLYCCSHVFLYLVIGTTPKSSGIFTTLQSVCQQIAENYKVPFEDIQEDFQELTSRFWELLKV